MDESVKKQGEELRVLAGYLFDRAVTYWYSAMITETVAGLLVVLVTFLHLSEKGNVFAAIIGFFVLGLSYILKLKFEETYGNAETMRRQSLLSESLGWLISETQFSEWRLLACEKLLNKLEARTTDHKYYQTDVILGAKRMLEMTAESAFWTRHLYYYLRKFVTATLAGSTLLFVGVITFTSTDIVNASATLKIVYAVYLLLPLVLS